MHHLIAAAVTVIVAFSALAAPFDMWFEARIADGRTIRIHGVGDEYAARFTDEEGRNLVYNPQVGAYEYAEREDDETFRKRALERRRKAEEESGLARRWAELKASRHQKASSKPTLKSPAFPIEYTKGRVVGVTLLVDFPVLDDNGVETNTLANTVHPDVTADDLRDLLNGTGFTKYGNISSVREYFLRESSGHLDYTNVVIGWIKAPYPREHYDDPTRDSRLCGGEFVCDMIEVLKADPRYETEFLPLLRQATVDDNTYFSRQSSAFGGQFRALNCFIAGNRSRAWANGLWPQQGYVPYEAIYDDDTHRFWLTIDSKEYYFWGYQITPISSQPMIGTFCHESGHLICDFPDLYTGSEGGGIGSLCLMSSNVFGDRPHHICAYLRAAARWVTPKELPSTPGLVTVTADIQDVWKFSHPTDPEQYYLIENRQESDYDYDIPGSGGVFIYRCDETGSNRYYERSNWWSAFVGYGDATNRLNFEVSVEQADGLYEVEQEGGDDGYDAWYFGNTGGMYAGRFNSETIPCARWRDGSPAGINLSRFSSCGHTMTFWNGAGGVDDQDVANDYMEDSIPILDRDAFSMHHDTGWRVTGVNSNATLQADEPLPQFLSATAHTLWWRWEAPWSMGEILRSRKLTFETTGSHHDDGSELDTVIGIYVYSEEDGTFTAIAENDDADVDNDVRTSRVSFTAKLFEKYYICVGGYGAAEVGEIQLSGSLRPMNDDWEDAIELPSDGVSGSSSAVNSNATATADEPLARRFDAKRTLWWKWTAPQDCKVKFDTLDSHDEDWNSLDTIMDVYTRSGETFTKIAETYDLGNDDVDDDSVTFMATGGVTYYVCVGVYGYEDLGVVGLHYRTWPLNDDWEGAVEISGGSGTATCGGAGGATIHGDEPQNEPLLSFNSRTRCTVWWKWTAPGTCDVVFGTIGSMTDGGSALDTVMGVYTRSDGAFSVVAENDDANDSNAPASRVGFRATEGTTYYICVGSVGSDGTIRLSWNATVVNDTLANRWGIVGGSGTETIWNRGATVSAGEPLAQYEPATGSTVWWMWAATSDGKVTFDTFGSQLDGGGVMDTVLGVYTNTPGAAGLESDMLKVVENDNVNYSRASSVTFAAKAGTLYYVCVGVRGGDRTGSVRLNWGPASDGTVGFVDLSKLVFSTTITDGTTIYGTLGGNHKVSIAPGATVTLAGVAINGVNSSAYPWAGLTCEGDATLVLDRSSVVRGFEEFYPGIYVPPFSTLVVTGGGSLDASSNGSGAGIGGGLGVHCGNIGVTNGTVVATGGAGAAGIGGGRYGVCGEISVSGGNVTATGGDGAPGIGGGREGSCGYVRIGNGIVRVSATRGDSGQNASFPIGAGLDGSGGYRSVGEGLVISGTASDATIVIAPRWDGNLATLSDDVTAADGTTIHGTLSGRHKVSIAAGATVTLSNAVVNGVHDNACPWAGITCEGNATIVLIGANVVKGFQVGRPGIHVPQDRVLTISAKSTGSLEASSNGYGAGIGGGFQIHCGHILIEGGTVVATGGNGAAGIGGGFEGICGTIGVTGGCVRSTRGGADSLVGTGSAIGKGGSGSGGGVYVGQGMVDDGGDPTRTIQWGGDLSALWCGVMVQDGMVVTGTLSGRQKVSIAAGATVTLSNAVVNGVHDNDCPWAGITCEGDATIVLAGTNVVRGFRVGQPGIHVPVGCRLTISARSTGSLVASSSGYGAGVGGGLGVDCGNVWIEGGAIYARGGFGAAGIGGGFESRCGDVVVMGGYVESFAGGGDNVLTGAGSAIGAGYAGSAGVVLAGTGMIDDEGAAVRTIRWNGDLSTLYVGDQGRASAFAVNGTTITGSRGAYYKLSVLPGATVTLSNAVVGGVNSSDCPWAGVNCLGDATIILKGTNTVQGFYQDYPGIHVPENSLLTIRGDGALAVSGSTDAGGTRWAAGIGGGFNVSCGSIYIAGGDITATGGLGAAGIGGGYNGPCGGILIDFGIVRVVATCGPYCGNPIGAGGYGSTPVPMVIPGLIDTTDGQTRTIVPGWNGDLSVADGDVTALDGMIVTGVLSGSHKISIEDGATVTLSNAVVNGVNDINCKWAGINCLGDATIILVGANVVKGFYEDYPGVHVPAGKTLTISALSTGSLGAGSNGYGAGIGGGFMVDGGNVRIEGGTITARAGNGAAGIGSGYGSCGSVSIVGGSVTAIGGNFSAGIGGGHQGSCGDIMIGAGIVRVVATCGKETPYPIGPGQEGTGGTVAPLPAGLSETTSANGSTIIITPGGEEYSGWTAASGVTGAWDATDASGVANVFRYAFDVPEGELTIFGKIEFDENGHAVVTTPPLVNGAGFTLTIIASDNVDGSGNATAYPLDPSGETTIDETRKTTRFFRLRAEQTE
jgi:M6 family metalloprotease-like protein